MNQAEVIGGFLVPAEQDGTEAMEPGMGPLHPLHSHYTGWRPRNLGLFRPAPRFSLGMPLGGDLLATGAQVGGRRIPWPDHVYEIP